MSASDRIEFFDILPIFVHYPNLMETLEKTSLEAYFEKYRRQIVGNDLTFSTPYGAKRMIYADWTASGRLYAPIEQMLSDDLGKFVGNTHTETTVTGHVP